MVMISCHLPTVSILIPMHTHHLNYAYVKNIPVDKLSIPRQTCALNTPLAPQLQTLYEPPTREEEYIWILSSDKALLNDTYINNCTVLLYSIYLPPICRQITILSTYELSCIRYNATDIELCQNTKGTSFWKTSIWILPIHRPMAKHWVMCTFNIGIQTLLLFDSLVE